jgi:hypothetical protein
VELDHALACDDDDAVGGQAFEDVFGRLGQIRTDAGVPGAMSRPSTFAGGLGDNHSTRFIHVPTAEVEVDPALETVNLVIFRYVFSVSD